MGNAARYFIEKYSEKIELCGAIDAYVNLQDFCLGDYLPEAVETAYERIPIFDSTILKSLSPKKTLILISNINAYEEIARQMSLYHLECFVLLLMEADLRLCSSYCASYMEQEKQTEYTCRRSAYADRCCRLPIEKKKIIFMIGKYGGHAKYITEALISKKCGLDIVWLVDDLRTQLPEGVRPVHINNWKKYIYEMETAGVWVFDILVPEFVRKRKEQTYIQTKHWSSITLKKFYLDDPSTTSTEREREHVNYNGKIIDYFFVGSEFDQTTCKSGFTYDGAFIDIGSPRSDAVFRTDLRSKVYSKYDIADHMHTVLYAPTFRYDKEQKKRLRCRDWILKGFKISWSGNLEGNGTFCLEDILRSSALEITAVREKG